MTPRLKVSSKAAAITEPFRCPWSISLFRYRHRPHDHVTGSDSPSDIGCEGQALMLSPVPGTSSNGRLGKVFNGGSHSLDTSRGSQAWSKALD